MLLRFAVLGGLGYAAYRYFEKMQQQAVQGGAVQSGGATQPAFAGDQGDATIRDAGPDAMRDPSHEPWSATDQELDESFPASDPPGNY